MDVDISIVIPVYKADETIRRCLDSLRRQNASLEVIAVDDCSQDGSLSTLKAFFDECPGINGRIIQHDSNQGVSASRNDGLQAATGKYVMFLDADDELDGNCCQRLLELAHSHTPDVACCNLMHCYSDGRTRPYARPVNGPLEFEGRQYPCMKHCWTLMDSCVGKLYRRGFLQEQQLGFRSGMKFGEDTLFTNRTLLKASRVVVQLDYFGYLYHDNASSCIHTIDLASRLSNLEMLLRQLKAILPEDETGLLERKSSEYLWSIRKFGGDDRLNQARAMVRSSLWSDLLYPVIMQHSKTSHRVIAWLLSRKCSWAISLW